MVCFLGVWLCFICVSFKITHIHIRFVCLRWVYVVIYWAPGELKTVSNQHIRRWKRTFPKHALAPICCIAMGAMASQSTSLTIVYSTVYSGADKRKHHISAALARVRGIHRWPMSSPHKWAVMRKMFPFDDVIMFPAQSKMWWKLYFALIRVLKNRW